MKLQRTLLMTAFLRSYPNADPLGTVFPSQTSKKLRSKSGGFGFERLIHKLWWKFNHLDDPTVIVPNPLWLEGAHVRHLSRLLSSMVWALRRMNKIPKQPVVAKVTAPDGSVTNNPVTQSFVEQVLDKELKIIDSVPAHESSIVNTNGAHLGRRPKTATIRKTSTSKNVRTRSSFGGVEGVSKSSRLLDDRKGLLTATTGGIVLCTAFGVAAFTEPSSNEYRVKALLIPHISKPPVTVNEELRSNTNHVFTMQTNIKSGDSVSSVLDRLSPANDPKIQKYLESQASVRRALAKLQVGTPVQAQFDAKGELKKISMPLTLRDSTQNILVLERNDGGGFNSKYTTESPEIDYELRSGVIQESFFDDMNVAGVPDSVIDQMVDIFSGVIDFHKNIQPGDAFRIVYEKKVIDGQMVGAGAVVAVEFTNRSQKYQAILDVVNGKRNYYTFDGVSLKRPFLRAPVEFSRMSSGFGLRRHPVFNQWRLHAGVDYAAPTGTKVFAAGDGVVKFRGVSTGYGNLIVIEHGRGKSTRYGHLSRFAEGIYPGKRVSQGQVIGYVGSTGWATGPHLHYEFRLSGRPVDPVKSIPEQPLQLVGREKQGFYARTAKLREKISTLRVFNVTELKPQ